MSRPRRGKDLKQAASFMANLAVELFTGALDVKLDYSPESLADVDRIVEELKKAELPDAQSKEALLRLSYYVGEVFVKHLRGEWIQTSADAPGAGGAARTLIRLPGGVDIDPVARLANLWRRGSGGSLARLYAAAAARPDAR